MRECAYPVSMLSCLKTGNASSASLKNKSNDIKNNDEDNDDNDDDDDDFKTQHIRSYFLHPGKTTNYTFIS